MSKEGKLINVCRMCDNEISCENPYELKEYESEHKDWCREITRPIYNYYQSTFREVYNIIELALPEDKAETMKSIIGNKLMETREKSIDLVVGYMVKD